jgi:hypothetical protein
MLHRRWWGAAEVKWATWRRGEPEGGDVELTVCVGPARDCLDPERVGGKELEDRASCA